MEKTEYRKHAAEMIAMTRCAVNGEQPEKTLTDGLDLPALFEVCQSHSLTACCAYALESAGIRDAAFTEAKEKSIRKNIIMDAERAKILKRLEQEQIWYMPLKGAVMKDWYPRLGMRQMSDNDILCDGAARARIKTLMEELGFTCKRYAEGNDDAYYKPPVCNFEMHNELFTQVHEGNLHDYYDDVKSRLCRDSENGFGYHFRNEDFYIYVLAHEYKHFMDGGTGVRSLLDTYIMLKKFGDSLDWDYIAHELETLGMTDYAAQNRRLAEKVFAGGALTADEERALDYYVTSGVYGTMEHRMENRIGADKQSKAQYLFRRIFPPMKQIQVYDPFFYRHKWLIPVLWIWRPIRGLTRRRGQIAGELRYLRQKQEK